MEIQSIFDEIQSLSAFELFRLQSAIYKTLEDPERVTALRQKIHVGMKVDYFCTERNHAIPCSVLKVSRSRVNVEEHDTQKRWSLPFYSLNLDHIETELVLPRTKGISKATLFIGSTVGFINNRDNTEHIGQVTKLNPKRAVILVNNTPWTVPYSMLFPVISCGSQEHDQMLLPR